MWLYFFKSVMAGDISIGGWLSHLGWLIGLTLFGFLAATMIPLIAGQIFNGAGTIASAAAGAVGGAVSTIARFL